MKFDVKQIKEDSINAGGVVVGMMGANAISQVVPVQNQLIKSSIPLAGGFIGTMASKNGFVKNISYGAMAFGALSLVRTLLVGQPTDTSTNGINGIGDNPTVKKVANLLLPNLGNVDEGVSVDTDLVDEFDFEEPDFEPDTEILNGIEENSGAFLGIEENSGAFLGIEDNDGAFLSGSYQYDPYQEGNNY